MTAQKRGESFMRRSLVIIAASMCAAGIVSAGAALAQRGPQVPPMVKEGATEKISDHVFVIPDGSVPLVPNVAIIVGSRTTFVVDTGLGTQSGEIGVTGGA